MIDTPVTGPTSDAELEVSLSGPALYSNKIILTVNEAYVRMGFLEHQGNIIRFRTAVLLTRADAKGVAELMLQLLQGN